MASAKSMPKDAHVMIAILKEMGVTDYEPRVINQMLEFTYREYVNKQISVISLAMDNEQPASIIAQRVRILILSLLPSLTPTAA